MIMPIVIDYSLYLVSGRNLLPPGKEFLASLEEAIQGGVTIVQIREKDAETHDFLQIAASSKSLCDKYGIPLIINDRIDIALAVKAHGVHLGQTDMPVAIARQLLPSDAIIGVSCNTVEHVQRAVKEGADYVGIGPVWSTTTKNLTNPVIGVRGVGPMLEVLDGTGIKAVAIGGIKAVNLLRTLHGSVSRTGHALDGIAVVSEIMASPQSFRASETLRKTFDAFRESYQAQLSRPTQGLWANSTAESIVRGVCELMEHVRKTAPLVHQITNTVVATQSANITLALGASPIMATEIQEMEDITCISGAHLINIGTLRAEYKPGMIKAGYFANANRKPIVLDPVGVGASQFRREVVKELLDTFQVSVIKGNAGELSALAESSEVLSKGVDSVGSFQDPVFFVRDLAKKERCIVAMTGKTDYVSDGERVIVLNNGHEILGKITGSGCIVGTAIATYCAASSTREGNDSCAASRLVGGDMLLGTVAGILVLTIASQHAVEREGVNGPGTFLPGLIDVLWDLTTDDISKFARLQVYND